MAINKVATRDAVKSSVRHPRGSPAGMESGKGTSVQRQGQGQDGKDAQ